MLVRASFHFMNQTRNSRVHQITLSETNKLSTFSHSYFQKFIRQIHVFRHWTHDPWVNLNQSLLSQKAQNSTHTEISTIKFTNIIACGVKLPTEKQWTVEHLSKVRKIHWTICLKWGISAKSWWKLMENQEKNDKLLRGHACWVTITMEQSLQNCI